MFFLINITLDSLSSVSASRVSKHSRMLNTFLHTIVYISHLINPKSGNELKIKKKHLANRIQVPGPVNY